MYDQSASLADLTNFGKLFGIGNSILYQSMRFKMCAECRFFRSQRTVRFCILLNTNQFANCCVR